MQSFRSLSALSNPVFRITYPFSSTHFRRASGNYTTDSHAQKRKFSALSSLSFGYAVPVLYFGMRSSVSRGLRSQVSITIWIRVFCGLPDRPRHAAGPERSTHSTRRSHICNLARNVLSGFCPFYSVRWPYCWWPVAVPRHRNRVERGVPVLPRTSRSRLYLKRAFRTSPRSIQRLPPIFPPLWPSKW